MTEPHIYVPPDANQDPFERARARARKRLLVGAGIVLMVALLGAAVTALLGWRKAAAGDARPGPLAADLARTDWHYPVDPATGYRRLASPLARGFVLDDAAIGADGTVALALRPRRGEVLLVVWREGRWRAFDIDGVDRITSVGVAPEGDVYAGLGDGTLARVEHGPTGALSRERPPTPHGVTVSRIAFHDRSPRSAVVMSDGSVFTAARPVRGARLRAARLPQRARIRAATFTPGGDLVLGGDAGAVFVATSDDWDEAPLATPGHVTAFGRDLSGEVLVAQSNGHVFRLDGVRWERIGQVGATPIAVGELADAGVTVVGNDGRVFATLGRSELSELPGYTRPEEGFVAISGDVAGHNVLVAASERVLVQGGAQWDTATITEGGACRPIGPPSIGVAGVAATIFDCGADAFEPGQQSEHAYAQILGTSMQAPASLRMGTAQTSVDDLAKAIQESRNNGATWAAGTLIRRTTQSELPAIERWTPSRRAWELLTPADVEEGALLWLGAAPAPGGADVWTLSSANVIRHALVPETLAPDQRPAFDIVVDARDFAAAYQAQAQIPSGIVGPLGDGVAIVAHGTGSPLLSRVRTSAVHRYEPLVMPELPTDPSQDEESRLYDRADYAVRAVGPTELVLNPRQIVVLERDGAPVTWTIPSGSRVRVASVATEPFLVASNGRGTIALLASVRGRVGEGVLRCRERRCESVALPGHVDAAGVFFTSDGRLAVWERDRAIGIVEPRR